MHTVSEKIRTHSYVLNQITIDTNASYAANWLKGFWENTLNNPTLLDKTLIVLTFDEVCEGYPGQNIS